MSRSSVHQLEAGKIHACGVGGLALVTLLAILMGVRPLFSRHSEMKLARTELAAEQTRSRELQHMETSLTSSLNRMRAELDANPLKLRKASLRNERLALLTELAADFGLSVDGIQTSEIETDNHYDKVPIVLTGMGRAPDCGRFLHALNEEFPDMGVASFDLKGHPGPKPADVGFTFDMIWYAAPSRLSLAD